MKRKNGTMSFMCDGDAVAFSLYNGDVRTVRGFHFDQGGILNDLLFGEITKIVFHLGVDNSPGHSVDAPMEMLLYQLAVGKDKSLADTIDDVRKTGRLPEEDLTGASRKANPTQNIDEQIFVIREGVATIGRSPECDLIEPDSAMSRKHAEIRITKGEAKIVDLGSANGIMVNRKAVTEMTLLDGNLIFMGNTVYRFLWAEGGIGVLFKMKGSESEVEDQPTLVIPS